MFKKLDEVESRFEQVQLDLQNPSVAQDQKKYRALMKDFSDLEKIVKVYRRHKQVIADLSSNKELLELEKDEEMRDLAKEEISSLEQEKENLDAQLKILLLPKDPHDGKNIILEIRAGAGGDEASLFTEELFRAYCHYADEKGWKVDILSISEGNVGGFKEVVASILGESVYERLKYERGVHRVQRVPKTESQGRIHTSTVTVAVLPEADDVEVNIDSKDLKVDVMRASGSGGQHINTTDSAVRLTHIPTGVMVYCQQEKSQIKNREKALKILYSRLLAIEEEKAVQEASEARLTQIGTGDRSERIRTYNFPQSRITDHRIGFTTHALTEVMAGTFDDVIQPLIAHFQAEALKSQGQEL